MENIRVRGKFLGELNYTQAVILGRAIGLDATVTSRFSTYRPGDELERALQKEFGYDFDLLRLYPYMTGPEFSQIKAKYFTDQPLSLYEVPIGKRANLGAAICGFWESVAMTLEIDPSQVRCYLPSGSTAMSCSQKLIEILSNRGISMAKIARALADLQKKPVICFDNGFHPFDLEYSPRSTTVIVSTPTEINVQISNHIAPALQVSAAQILEPKQETLLERRNRLIENSLERMKDLLDSIFEPLQKCDLLDSDDDLTMIEATIEQVEETIESAVKQVQSDHVDLAVDVLKQQRQEKDDAAANAKKQRHQTALQRGEVLKNQREAARRTDEQKQQQAAATQQQQQLQMMQQMMMQMMAFNQPAAYAPNPYAQAPVQGPMSSVPLQGPNPHLYQSPMWTASPASTTADNQTQTSGK
jgi:hypothetical protein